MALLEYALEILATLIPALVAACTSTPIANIPRVHKGKSTTLRNTVTKKGQVLQIRVFWIAFLQTSFTHLSIPYQHPAFLSFDLSAVIGKRSNQC